MKNFDRLLHPEEPRSGVMKGEAAVFQQPKKGFEFVAYFVPASTPPFSPQAAR
jgi:hypothetical protein